MAVNSAMELPPGVYFKSMNMEEEVEAVGRNYPHGQSKQAISIDAGSSSISINDYAQPRILSTAECHSRDKRNKIAFSSVLLRAQTPNTTVKRANKIINVASGDTQIKQVDIN